MSETATEERYERALREIVRIYDDPDACEYGEGEEVREMYRVAMNALSTDPLCTCPPDIPDYAYKPGCPRHEAAAERYRNFGRMA